ncbi:MAG: VIT1/CCC1 transporter family protein [Candidatus Roizmanbacteria bacterium]|nr:MAG: VIT1/CCC1 transporter family protein [Candidatus Roizmanbacteria bacterium]
MKLKKQHTGFDLKKHLALEHRLSPLSIYLREIVYGGNDGIVTTFAVVAGFAGAQTQNFEKISLLLVLLFGLANLFADGVSMALGNFLSTRSHQNVYFSEEKKERYEIRNNPEAEKAESIEILMQKGFSKAQAEKLVSIYATNEKYWLNFMMSQELEMADPGRDKPVFMALATFTSFIVFGLIPLIPYLFFRNDPNIFMFSAISTFLALIILGVLRWRLSTESWLRSVGETILLGGVAAIVAYFIGSLFRL